MPVLFPHGWRIAVLALAPFALAPAAWAQNSPAPAAAPPAAAPAPVAGAAKAPDSLVLYFDSGSAKVRTQDAALLDQAARLYRDGHPIVMVVSGSSDAVGNAKSNLLLSQRRAETVVNDLIARGIPAERFQVLAKGATDPVVPDPQGAPEAQDRRVEITWR